MELADAQRINAAILKQYQAVRDKPELKRSHYFEGRYENIYVPREDVPALAQVLEEAVKGARGFLDNMDISLSVGYWFNEMGPGHVTLPHSHDEDDELVSGVYYVSVPESSGDLILTSGAASTRVTPAEGMFVFFSPAIRHEVTKNLGSGTRLSIGMNFGKSRPPAV